jgi:hypothetical protein
VMKVPTYEADITYIRGLVFASRVDRFPYESGSAVSLVTSQELDDWLRFPAETAVSPRATVSRLAPGTTQPHLSAYRGLFSRTQNGRGVKLYLDSIHGLGEIPN